MTLGSLSSTSGPIEISEQTESIDEDGQSEPAVPSERWRTAGTLLVELGGIRGT